MKNFTLTKKHQHKLFFLLIGLLMVTLSLHAGTKTSTGSTNWGTASTWSPSGVPTSSDDVIIASPHSVTINANSQTCKTLTVNSGATLKFSANTASNLFTVNGDFTINGTFTQNNNQGWPVDVYGNLTINGTYSTTEQNVTNVKIAMRGAGGTTIGGTALAADPGSNKRFGILEINLSSSTGVVTLQSNLYFDGTNGTNGQLKITQGIFDGGGKQLHWRKYGSITTTANGKIAWKDSNCTYTDANLPSIYYDSPNSASYFTVTGTVYFKDFIYPPAQNNWSFPNNASANVWVFGNFERRDSNVNLSTGTWVWGSSSNYYGTQYNAANKPATAVANATGPANIGTASMTANAAYVMNSTMKGYVDACSAPTLTEANNTNGQVAAGNITADGSTNNVIANFQVGVSSNNATLNTVAFTTTGTATASDITNFQLWFNASSSTGGPGSGATSIKTISGAGAGTQTFGSLTQAISSGTTGYFWITAQIPTSATYNRTITVGATPALTFALGTATGTTSAAGAQAIITAPTTTTGTATSITTTGATLGGTVSYNGASTTVTFNSGTSLSYGTNTTANESPVGSQSAAVTGTLSSLTPNTLYHFRVNGSNSVGNATAGSDASFTTLPNAPSISSGNNTSAQASVGPTYFTAYWTAPVGQGSETYTYTIQVDDDNAFGSVNASATGIASGTTSALINTGLSAGGTYYYRVKAVNLGGTQSSDWSSPISDVVATTSPTAPVFVSSSNTATAVTNNSATLGANILSNGGSATTDYGTAFKTSSPVAATDNQLSFGTTDYTGVFTQSRTGLDAQTLYYYVGYATNGIGTNISSEGSFRTLSNPPTGEAGSFTATPGIAQVQLDWTTASFPVSGATETGYIVLRRQDGSNPATTGIVNATAPGSLSLPGGTTLVTTITSGATLTYTNTSLSNGQAYNYLIVPFTWDGTNVVTYNYLTTAAPAATATTPNSPTATTGAATSVTTTGVTLNGTVSANGLSSVVTFNYGTSGSYGTDIAASESPVTTQSASVSAPISGLTANTLYHYRVSGTNGVGTTNGNDGTATTLSNAPTVGGASSPTSSGFTANWTAPTGQGSEAITYTVDVSTSNTFGSIAKTVTGISGTSSAITLLSASTTYYFRVKAVNAGGSSAWSAASGAVITGDADSDGSAPAVGNNINSVADQYTLQSRQRTRYVYDDGTSNTVNGFAAITLKFNNSAATPADFGTGYDTKYAWYMTVNGSNYALQNVSTGRYVIDGGGTPGDGYVGFVAGSCDTRNWNTVSLVTEATFNGITDNNKKYWTRSTPNAGYYQFASLYGATDVNYNGYYLNTDYTGTNNGNNATNVLVSGANCTNTRDFAYTKYTATPDLAVTGVTTSLVGTTAAVSTPFTATATIKNNGLLAINSGTSIKVKFVFGGQIYTTTYTGGLAAGASATLPAVTITPNQELASVSLVTTVNSNWAVAEYNYSNNTNTISSLQVKTAYYYRTEANGNWTSTSLWQHSTDGITWETTNTVPNEVAKNVTIANTVTVPDGSGVSASKVNINLDSKLTVAGTLTVSDTITFVSTDAGTSQLLVNNGTVNNNGVVKVRKTFSTANGWYFVSFPFDVPAAKIFIGGTTTGASWGDIGDTGKDFYVAEYDGAKRAATGTWVATNSDNWVSLGTHTLMANKGYIIAPEVDITLDFVSAASPGGTLFATTANETLIDTYFNALASHRNWNLVGTPFACSFDLLHATQEQTPFYIFNGTSYDPVMADDSYQASPFTSFFLQANPEAAIPTELNFANGGRLLKAAFVPNFDEIGLVVKNAKYSDKLRIRLQKGASKTYEIGKDAVKFFAPKAEVPQIFCNQNGQNLSVNSLPANTTKVEVSVKIGEDGTYTISLADIAKAAGCSQVILEDGDTQTDLLAAGSYSFAGTAGSTKSLSVLLVPTGTSNVSTQDAAIVIKAVAGKAYISGLQGAATVNVYDVAGKLVQSFTNVTNDQALTLRAKGVCIIDVKTATQTGKAKVSVE